MENLLNKKKPRKLRHVLGVSVNPEEHDAVQVMMASAGYSNFSQFAKSRIFGTASESEKRLHELEIAVGNLHEGYERHHKQWVDTVKQVTGHDLEPLIAAVYVMQHLGARPQDRAHLDRFMDLELVERTLRDDSNGYRRQDAASAATHYTRPSTSSRPINPYLQGRDAAMVDRRAE